MFLMACSAGWCADKYVTPAGAGLKDGSDWDNAFGAAEFFADIASTGKIAAGDTYYIMGGQGDYTLTSHVGTWDVYGSSNDPIRMVGVQDTNLTLAQGANKPNFILGKYQFLVRVWDVRNIRYTASLGQFYSASGLFMVNCDFTGSGNHGTNGVVYAYNGKTTLVNCSFITEYPGNRLVYVRYTAAAFFYGCTFKSNNQLPVEGYYSPFINCIFDGAVPVTPRELIGCTVRGISDIEFAGGAIILNTVFEGMDCAIKTNGVKWIYADHSNMHNCTIKSSIDGGSTEDVSILGDNIYELDPQFTDAANGDFSIGPNLKGLGFPGAFPGISTTGYMDIGAVQREEPESSGGGEHSAVYVF